MLLAADLHVHTVLSPCASREMTPQAIVRAAVERGLSMLAVCDHNAAGNALAVQRAAGPGLAVLAGIEITTREEVHLVGLFPDAPAALSAASVVQESLPAQTGAQPSWMGPQQLMSSHDRECGIEPKMLATACGLSIEQAVQLVHQHGGLAIAAHVDRHAFGLIAQLGMLPPGLPLDALEVSSAGLASGRHLELAAHGYPIVASSDAHSLDELGESSTGFEVQSACFSEVVLALQAREGRGCFLA
jgi:hypothetical protein